MAKDPADRYQSCSDLTDALFEPGDAGRPAGRRRRRPPIGRRALRRGSLAVAAALLTTLVVAGVLHLSAGDSSGSPPASSSGDSSPHSTPATNTWVSESALNRLIRQARIRKCGHVQDEPSTGAKSIYCDLHGKRATANGGAASLTIHMYPRLWSSLYEPYRSDLQRHRATDPLLAPENSQNRA